MNKPNALDDAISTSRIFRVSERINRASEIALANSLTGRALTALGRVASGSAVGRLFTKPTEYRRLLSGSLLATFLTTIFAALRSPAERASAYLSAKTARPREIWAGSRFGDYSRFLFRYEVGVVFLALFIPVELFLFDYIPKTTKYSVELVLLLMTGALFLSAIAKRRELRATELELPVLAFVVIACVSALANGVPLLIALAGVRALLQFYLLYFVVVQAEFDRAKLRKFVLGLLGFALLLTLFGLGQKFAGLKTPTMVDIRETTIGGRIVSTLANPNNFGGFLLFFVPMAVALLIERTDAWVRVFAGAASLLMMVALIFTYSRGAWLGLGAAFIVLAVLLDKRIVLGIAVALAAVFLFVPSVIDRLSFALSSGYIKSSAEAGRLLYWAKAIQIMETNPLFGVGPGRFGGAVAAIFGTPANALVGMAPNYQLWVDSQVFQIMGELGLLGIAAYFWVAVTFARNAIAFAKSELDPFWRAYSIGAVAAIVGIMVQGVFVGVWETQQLAAFFWLTTAIVMSLAVRKALPKA
ncbi:MAG: O-antigen ligase family protein [Chloroflexi bacterium]|nr:O-antigen ligase family protein [Chloroflexota bacterium]